MENNKSTNRNLNEINSKEDVEFLCCWLRALFQVDDSDLRGKMNGISIALTGKFISLDVAGAISVCEREK